MRDLNTLQRKASAHGAYVGTYAAAVLEHPLPWTKMRQVYRLLGLVRRHGADAVNDAVLVAAQAVAGQGENVFRPSTGIDADLSRDPHLDRLEGVEVSAENSHDFRREVAAGFAAFGLGGDVAALDGEIAGQSRRCLSRPGQAEGADARRSLAHVTADAIAAVSADLADRLQVGQPVQEILDVATAQRVCGRGIPTADAAR
jgi:hypothetical protein